MNSVMTYVYWNTRRNRTLVDLLNTSPGGALDYGLHISRENKFLYVDNPKVGSGTIKTRLACFMDPRINPEKFDPHKSTDTPLSSPPYMSDEDIEEALFSDRYFKFCFVRNPYTRVLSAYLDKLSLDWVVRHLNKYDSLSNRKKTRLDKRIAQRKECMLALGKDEKDWMKNVRFDEFINWIEKTPWYECNIHWRLQSDNILFNKINYDYIGRFESLGADLNHVLSIIFPSKADSEARHDQLGYATSADDKASAYYTDDLCSRVRALYAEDFQNFNYDLRPAFGGKE